MQSKMSEQGTGFNERRAAKTEFKTQSSIMVQAGERSEASLKMPACGTWSVDSMDPDSSIGPLNSRKLLRHRD